MQAIIETATRCITHYPAPLDLDGNVRMPEGDGYEAVELSDADAELIGVTNARYSVTAEVDGKEMRLVVVEVAVEPVADPDAELDAAITAATTFAQLRAALLGSRGGRIKARPAEPQA